jgi:hypothetical protein
MAAATAGHTAGQPLEDSTDHPLSVGREVRRTLRGVTTRQEQRRRLVRVLAFAQLLLALAAVPGYISPNLAVGALAILGAAIAVSLLSLAASRGANTGTIAAYTLVFGGWLVTLAHLALTGLAGDASATAQASLFFLPMILAAGVLFSAEVTLVLVALAATFTAAALVFALAQGQTTPTNAIYLMVVYSLSLEALAGLIAWLVAQFLFESGSAAQRAAQQRFSQAQLEALQGLQAKQQQRLQAEIQALQDAITRVLSGAYVARVDVVPGELAELMQSFNLLLDRIHSLVGTEQGRDTTSELVGQMLVLIGEIAEGNAARARGVDPRAGGPLGAVMQALLHLQTRSAHRSARIQELVSDVAGAVQTGLDGLSNTTQDMEAATRIAGRLVSAADQLAPAIKSSHALVLHARDLVGRLLPPALLQAAAQDAVHRDASGLTPEEAGKLLGRYDDLDGLDVLGAGATGEFEALRPVDDVIPDPAIPPLTMPLPTIASEPAWTQTPDAAQTGADPGDAQAQLLDLWRMLDRLAAILAQQYRTLRSVSRELGKLSRSVRSADAGVVHGAASLDAAREAVRDLHDIVWPSRAPVYPNEQPSAALRRAENWGPAPSMPAEPPSAAEFFGLGLDSSSPADLSGDDGQLDLRQLIDPAFFANSSPNDGAARSRDEDDSPA